MPKIWRRNCDQCNHYYEGTGKNFCSASCRQTSRNLTDNPSKSPGGRQRLSKLHSGNTYSVGRPMSDVTRAKIAIALQGRTCDPVGIKKRIASLKHRRITVGWTEKELAQILALHKRGPEHPSWKGGTSRQRDKEYKTEQYRTFVNSVLRRDNYTCQDCGARNGNGFDVKLEVHHVQSYAEHPNLRYEPSNGIALCVRCHNKTQRSHRRPVTCDFVPRQRMCVKCGEPFAIKGGKDYCPACRERYACPVCRSTKCGHKARRELSQLSLALE